MWFQDLNADIRLGLLFFIIFFLLHLNLKGSVMLSLVFLFCFSDSLLFPLASIPRAKSLPGLELELNSVAGRC